MTEDYTKLLVLNFCSVFRNMNVYFMYNLLDFNFINKILSASKKKLIYTFKIYSILQGHIKYN